MDVHRTFSCDRVSATLAQLDQVKGFFYGFASGGEVVGSRLAATGTDPAPPGRDTVATKQSRLYLDDVLPVSVFRRIDGTEDDHVWGLNEVNNFTLSVGTALDVSLCCPDPAVTS